MDSIMPYKKVEKDRVRKSLNLGFKLDVIRRYEAGQSQVTISRALNIAGSTVRTILKKSEKIKKMENFYPLDKVGLCRTRTDLMNEMETQLTAWIIKNSHEDLVLNFGQIRDKAKIIYDELRKNYPNGNEAEPFYGSRGWFSRFQKRMHFLCRNGDNMALLPYMTPCEVTYDESSAHDDSNHISIPVDPFSVDTSNVTVKQELMDDSGTENESGPSGKEWVDVGDAFKEEHYVHQPSQMSSGITITPINQNTVEIEVEPKDKTRETEFEIFGRSIGAHLSNMPVRDALELQLIIQQAITQYRLRKCGQSSIIP